MPKTAWKPLTKLDVIKEIISILKSFTHEEPYTTNVIFRIKSVIERWEYQQLYLNKKV